jgi:Phytanoyl-CoA dioxygenase (PhyH)
MKEQYQKNGYHPFRAVLPEDEVTALGDMVYDLITPYRGQIRRQDGNFAVNEFHPASSLVKNSILNAHFSLPDDLKPISLALRSLIASSQMYDSLHGLDGAEHYTIHQTIIFISAQITVPHLDSWSIDTAPHGFSHTVWIPLEDMDYLSGLPAVVPWPVGKFVTEADIGLPDGDFSFRERHDRYCEALTERLRSTGADVRTLFMRKGDFVVWSSLTPHFSLPSTPFPRRRLSVQVLIRPTHHRWGNFVVQPAEWTPDRAEQVSERFSFNAV